MNKLGISEKDLKLAVWSKQKPRDAGTYIIRFPGAKVPVSILKLQKVGKGFKATFLPSGLEKPFAQIKEGVFEWTVLLKKTDGS